MHLLLHEAHSQIVAENYDSARATLLQAFKLREDIKDPAAVDYLLMSLGTTWLLTDKYEAAIAFFSEYIAGHPTEPGPFCERAGARWYAGQLEKAIDDYSQALELEPNDILSLSGRGQVLAETGQHEKAIRDLNLALQLLKTIPATNPSWSKWYEQIEAFVRNGRGVALASMGENGSAMEEFELSIRLSSENAWVYYNRAQVYDLARDLEKACSDYQTALMKRLPALNPLRKERAQARLHELSGHS